jgi:hypothetical protein
MFCINPTQIVIDWAVFQNAYCQKQADQNHQIYFQHLNLQMRPVSQPSRHSLLLRWPLRWGLLYWNLCGVRYSRQRTHVTSAHALSNLCHFIH